MCIISLTLVEASQTIIGITVLRVVSLTDLFTWEPRWILEKTATKAIFIPISRKWSVIPIAVLTWTLIRYVMIARQRDCLPVTSENNAAGENHFEPDPPVAFPVGEWFCFEMMMRANTAGNHDGSMAYWVNDTLIHKVEGMMWRTSPTLALNRVRLQHYITTEDAQGFSNRVWFDDVVVSTEKIGLGNTPIIETLSPNLQKVTAFRIYKVSRDDIQFKVVLGKAGAYTLEVYDLSGKKLWKHKQANARKGVNLLRWNRHKNVPHLIIAVLRYAKKHHYRLFVVF